MTLGDIFGVALVVLFVIGMIQAGSR